MAVYVLRGFAPQQCSTDELIARFPDARPMLVSYYGTLYAREQAGIDDASLEGQPEQQAQLFSNGFEFVDKPDPPLIERRTKLEESGADFPCDALSWIRHEIGERHPLAEQWRFIFAYKRRTKPPEYIFDQEMDYRELLRSYVQDGKLSANILVHYALTLPRPGNLLSAHDEERRKTLLFVIHDLVVDHPATSENEIAGLMIPTRRFVDELLVTDYRYQIDKRCGIYAGWTRDYPVIAEWLRVKPLHEKPLELVGRETTSSADPRKLIACHIQSRLELDRNRVSRGNMLRWAKGKTVGSMVSVFDNEPTRLAYWFTGVEDLTQDDIKQSRNLASCKLHWNPNGEQGVNLRTFWDTYLARS